MKFVLPFVLTPVTVLTRQPVLATMLRPGSRMTVRPSSATLSRTVSIKSLQQEQDAVVSAGAGLSEASKANKCLCMRQVPEIRVKAESKSACEADCVGYSNHVTMNKQRCLV